MSPKHGRPAPRRFQTDEEYEKEQLLMDLESEICQVQTIKLKIQKRIDLLLQDRKYLKQQERRLQRQDDHDGAGAATARMLQMQEKERQRLAAAQDKYDYEEKTAKDEAERARYRREYAIETQDGDIEDLDAFLAQDAANF